MHPTLTWTHHADDRARQRAIAASVAELAYLEGRPVAGSPDRYLLTRERVRELTSGPYAPALLARAEKAAPVIVVVDGGITLLTLFRPTRGIRWRFRRRPGADPAPRRGRVRRNDHAASHARAVR